MKLERYTNQELTKICKDIFFDYMSNENESFYERGGWNSIEKTPVDAVHSYLLGLVDKDKERIKMFQEALDTYHCNEQCQKALRDQMNYLQKEIGYLQTANMSSQKEIYQKTHKIDYSRTAVRIPLDKRINSYYDDLILEVIFFDDVCTLNSNYETYASLETKEDRMNFIKENVEITHIGLSYFKDKSHIFTIGVQGNLNFEDPRIKESRVLLLDHKFSDFENLTLADTMEILNNDIRQFLQSKIDLDKEQFTKLAEKTVRGDVYGIYKSPYSTELYIRYTCPSTGRVYYNVLNLRNLRLSPYYEEENTESYIDSWWNINTLGGKVEGEPILRC